MGDDIAYRRLWQGVLMQACKDLTVPLTVSSSTYMKETLTHRRAIRQDARDFFEDRYGDLEIVCGAAGVDPDTVYQAYLTGELLTEIQKAGVGFSLWKHKRNKTRRSKRKPRKSTAQS